MMEADPEAVPVALILVFVSSPTPCALKIADKIAEQFENAVLLMVRVAERKRL